MCTPSRGDASPESTLRDTTGPPVVDTDFSTGPDYLQLEAVTLQRQQTALQAQQNRIVELLAVNQNKTKLPQPRVPIFDGNPVDYRSFIRAFESLIESRTCNSTERLYYLEQYTTGDVKELIKSCHHLPPDVGYQEARKLLKKKFGDEYRVASAYESKALSWPPIKSEDGTALNKFAIFLSSCKNALAGSQYASKFDQPGNIQKLIFKLPFNMRERWRRSADDIMERQLRPVEFNDLVAFMDREARIATNPVFGNISGNAQPFFNSRERKPSQLPVGFRSSKPKTTTFATQVKNNQSMNSEKNPCADPARSDVPSVVCIFCQQNHALEDCHLLRWKPYQERIKFLSAKRLCFGCLSEKHVARLCPERKICKIPNCTRKHPTVLHTSNVREKSSVDVGVGTEDSADTPVLNAMAYTEKCSSSLDLGEARPRTAMAVIPVKIRLKSSNQTIITYAFLDNGSSATFCTESLMRKLGVDGTKVKISLSTLEKKNSPVDSYLIRDLVVSDLDENHFVHLPTLYTRPEIPVSKEDIPTQEDVDQWPHLDGVFIPQVDAEIGLLIASDVPEALDPVEVKHSQNGGPYATRTCMGWAVNGPLGRFRGRSHTSSFFLKVDPQLQQMVESFYNRDFVDLFADDTKEMSQDEHRFMQNAEKIQFKDGHYEIPLPFKNHASSVPNNKSHALVRVEWLKRKLERDPKLCDDYQVFMKELLNKGYARKVPPEQLNPLEGSAWYIPHHGVYHPHKPGKIRVVFDCSAKFSGISLNSMLHKGPDLTNSLIGVLTRFRGERVAVMADIESMFHQVRVPEHDSSFLRFLWWDDGNLAGEVQEYQMLVHLFGAISSPASANFALRRTATDNKQCFPDDVINTVKRNFYVDDCLKSLSSEAAAITHVHDLQALLSRGGFKLTKWISNSRKVIEAIPAHERCAELKKLDFYKNELPSQRALGLQWCVESDTFTFNICLRSRPFTRRGILSVVGSVFDPLGFVVPFILNAKQILQDLCRIKLGWDDEIPPEYYSSWEKWLADVPKLSSFSICRSVLPEAFGPVVSSQLHHFSDASEAAYGSVSYLRLVDEEGRVHCSFLFAKSRLAPLKSVSIPRLELSAATLSVRHDKMLKREIEMSFSDPSVFWTDSMSVLRYVKNESKRFHTFVANRITTIRDGSTPDQWYHVGSAMNPGDHTSRGLSAEAFLNCTEWLLGPEFLWKFELQWPKLTDSSITIPSGDPEVKAHATSFATSFNPPITTLSDFFQRISSWYRFKKAVAWILRYRSNLLMASKSRVQSDQLKNPIEKPSFISVEEMERAEKAILQNVQQTAFPAEIRQLTGPSGSKHVRRSSPLFKLDPVLRNGLLCVGGRLSWARISLDAKHQIILPKNDHVSNLIINHYHTLSGHSGRQHVLSLLRQRYWVIKANSAVRKILTKCYRCRKREAPFCEQKMADLPEDRLVPDRPPNHLLLLKSDTMMPPGVFQKEDLLSRRRWRQIQYLSDIFWKRWSREYLPLLQSRQKWLYPRRNLAVGDVVLVAAENASRNSWPLGRIEQVFPDKKGFVRRVKVNVKSAILERPVDKLVLLVEGK